MIKKVKTEDLRPGVYVHDFNCDWNGENIFIERMVIRDTGMIEIIRSWGIKEVFIDTERGLDLEGPGPGKKKQGADSLHETAENERVRKPQPPQVPLKEEVSRAVKIRDEAIELVEKSISRVMDGKPPEVGMSYDLAYRMKKSLRRNRDALLLLTRMRRKDQYTLYHSISVSSLVLDMCSFNNIGEDRTLDFAVGALFHDIGKTKVPTFILNKPGKLTKSEYGEIRKHSEYSVDLLRQARGLPMECYDIALHHHERFDGLGYPHGLKGEQISYGSQLTSVCDVFDAIISERCYKDGIDTVTGLKMLYQGSGKHFSKELVHDFIRCVGVYPVGSWVKTMEGWVGVVISSTENMMQPVVKIFYDEKKKKKVRPFKIDLAKTDGSIAGYAAPRGTASHSKTFFTELIA